MERKVMACTMSTFMCKINVIGLMFRHSKFFLSSFLAIALGRDNYCNTCP